MRRRNNRILALLLSAALLCTTLAGCNLLGGDKDADEAQSPGAEQQPQEENSPQLDGEGKLTSAIQGDGKFTLNYSGNTALHPYTSASKDDLAVTGLIYEGLFGLEDGFTPVKVLCEELSTTDGLTYILKIKSGVQFHSGGSLMVEDVLYSLELAMDSDLYGSRMSVIDSVRQAVDSEGEPMENTIELVLRQTHGNLEVLLTAPIIELDSYYDTRPAGTGPYVFNANEASPCLNPFAGHWSGQEMPVDVIYLRQAATLSELTALFNSELIDVIGLDMSETTLGGLSTDQETRNYNTTMMEYLGFNIWRGETGRTEVRQAISYAIDRAYITEAIMDGNGIATPLPFHPALAYYDGELAEEFAYDLDKARQLLAGEIDPVNVTEGEAEDGDEQTQLDPTPTETPKPDGEDDEDAEDDQPQIELTILVCDDNTARMETVSYIARCIAQLGYKVTIDARSYNDYLKALEDAEFDLFYGQVRLTPDFDLSAVLTGSLQHAGMDTTGNYGELIRNFLASGGPDRTEQARILAREVLVNAPIAVVGFRNLSVVTHRGTVTGMNPNQDNLYYGVAGWSVNVR